MPASYTVLLSHECNLTQMSPNVYSTVGFSFALCSAKTAFSKLVTLDTTKSNSFFIENFAELLRENN